ncbi:hypothetical protein M595_0996 [Lyngbya aestuarii BL J]|uniref:Uncharacterized protein n=1 Tax=Lyngbya aestuarii BL J TaxID=1348334 RepID=U7QRG7_9CYAN|nr:hypothetical protein M595_0996 [Lyngbya aestuarii BL J]
MVIRNKLSLTTILSHSLRSIQVLGWVTTDNLIVEIRNFLMLSTLLLGDRLNVK